MTLTRRDVLGGTAASVIAYGCGPNTDLGLTSASTYDEVIAALYKTDLEFGNYGNHGPMVADALVALEREERVAEWVQKYERSVPMRPTAGGLDASQWTASLGKYDKRAGWIATFEASLKAGPPKHVVREWFPLLAPGLSGALWHGLIRTAHAVRSFERKDTEARRMEFAHGLGWWASRYLPLPGVPGARPMPGRTVLTALQETPLVPTSARVFTDNEVLRYPSLNGRTEFIDAVETVDLKAQSPEDAVTALVNAAARLFVHHGQRDIILLHVITGSSVMRLLLSWLERADQERAVGYLFQSVAATYATYAPSTKSLDPVAPPAKTVDALVATAKESGDAHSIKLGEATRREHALRGDTDVVAALNSWLG